MATKTVVAEMKIDFPYNDDRLRADEVNLRGNEDGRGLFIRIFTLSYQLPYTETTPSG